MLSITIVDIDCFKAGVSENYEESSVMKNNSKSTKPEISLKCLKQHSKQLKIDDDNISLDVIFKVF